MHPGKLEGTDFARNSEIPEGQGTGLYVPIRPHLERRETPLDPAF